MHCDDIILSLAASQHGLVNRTQLLAAGIAAHRIEHRVKVRRLEPVHRGVYRMGPVRSPQENAMAAALACGPCSLVSHASGATLWEFATGVNDLVHVSMWCGHRRPPTGVRIHRVRVLPPEERAQLAGIPVTSVARTLLDYAADADEHAVERALAIAERSRLVDTAALEQMVMRYPRNRGAAKLRRLLAWQHAPALTRSEAEARFLDLLRRAQLPRPVVNQRVRGHEVDFLWRTHQLAVEIDGYTWHASKSSFERDRQRDATLLAAGLRVMRVTWRQLMESPEAVLARVAQALIHAGLHDGSGE